MSSQLHRIAVLLAIAVLPAAAHAAAILVQSDRAILTTAYNGDPAVCGGFGIARGRHAEGPLFAAPPLAVTSEFCGEVLSAAARFAPTGPELSATRLAASVARGEAMTRYFMTFDVTGPGASVLLSGFVQLLDVTTARQVAWVTAPAEPVTLEPHRYELYLIARSAFSSSEGLPPIGPMAYARFSGAEFQVPEPASMALLALGLAGVAVVTGSAVARRRVR